MRVPWSEVSYWLGGPIIICLRAAMQPIFAAAQWSLLQPRVVGLSALHSPSFCPPSTRHRFSQLQESVISLCRRVDIRKESSMGIECGTALRTLSLTHDISLGVRCCSSSDNRLLLGSMATCCTKLDNAQRCRDVPGDSAAYSSFPTIVGDLRECRGHNTRPCQ